MRGNFKGLVARGVFGAAGAAWPGHRAKRGCSGAAACGRPPASRLARGAVSRREGSLASHAPQTPRASSRRAVTRQRTMPVGLGAVEAPNPTSVPRARANAPRPPECTAAHPGGRPQTAAPQRTPSPRCPDRGLPRSDRGRRTESSERLVGSAVVAQASGAASLRVAPADTATSHGVASNEARNR